MCCRHTEDQAQVSGRGADVKRIILALAFSGVACATTVPPVTVAARTRPAAAASQSSAAQSANTVAAASQLPNAKDSVKFAVIGDTGTGGSGQYQVGKLLADARG